MGFQLIGSFKAAPLDLQLDPQLRLLKASTSSFQLPN